MTTPKRILTRALQYARECLGPGWDKTARERTWRADTLRREIKSAYLLGYLEGRLDEAGKLELQVFEYICNDCQKALPVTEREREHADQTATNYYQWSEREGIWRCSACHEQWRIRPRRQEGTAT